MGRLTATHVLAAAAAAPGVALGVLTVGWLALALVDRHPFWRYEPLTLAEAAALRDAGEVARLLAAGVDPNGRYEVRAGVLRRAAQMLTPLEAATAARRPEIVMLLLQAGALPEDEGEEGARSR